MPSKAQIPIRTDNQGAREHQALTIFPTLIERTERQVDVLLTVLDKLENFTFKGREDDKASWSDCAPELAAKATSTSLHALSQLDNILDDMSRWDSSGGALEQSYNRYLENAAKASEASLFHVAQSNAPHIRHKAVLVRVDLNDWVSVIGAGTNQQVLGRGPTPYDALRDFDEKFLHGFDPTAKVIAVQPIAPKKPRKKRS